MSQMLLAAVLIMPLSFASMEARSQMVAVPAAESTQNFLGESSAKLYSTAASTAGDPGTGEVTASDAASVEDGLPPTSAEPLSSSSSLRETLPTNITAVTPDLGTLPPSPADPAAPAPTFSGLGVPAPGPVTLPPKPTKVRDLPAPGGNDRPRVRPFRAAAFGVTASSLGAGGELAIPVAGTLNARVGASYVLWRYPFNIDGIDYNPGLKFTSGRATIDWFPHHGAFHVSAGALYFRNSIGGSADVVEGQSFSLGGTSYSNSVDDPIHGTATITYGKQIAPMVLLGFGNILPRSGRHLSMPFEFGGAYMEPPTLKLKLQGTACTTQGCFNAATDPEVQANVQKEVNTLQGDIRFLEVYPVVSLGLACRF